VRRGEVWTVAAGAGYAGKPRPVVIVQDDAFEGTDSVTICAFTTDPADAPLLRLLVEANDTNGLHASCRLMIDKLTTVRRSKIGRRIGRLDVEDIVRMNRAILVFLGLASSARGEF
jgi:mRNA interferase MazF